MMRKSIFVFIMFLFFFAVRAEVFTLWPYSGGGSVLSSKVDSIPGIDREILLIEPMIVNGVRLKLEVRRIDSTFDNLILFLKENFDPKELRAAGDTIRVAYKTGEKQVERWLIVNSGDGKPLTMFCITSPLKLPGPGEWPASLPPLPVGAKAVQVVEFPGRKAVYGSFENSGNSPEQLLRNTSDFLRSRGWQAAGNEADPSIQGNGDLFLRANPRELMWVSYGAAGNGAYYTRPY